MTSPQPQQGQSARVITQWATLLADALDNFNFSLLFSDGWNTLCDIGWVSNWFYRFIFTPIKTNNLPLSARKLLMASVFLRRRTSRTRAWDNLRNTAHTAFCGMILTMMFTKPITQGSTCRAGMPGTAHYTLPRVYISQSEPLRACDRSIFVTSTGGCWSATLVKVIKCFWCKTQSSRVNSRLHFMKKDLLCFNCLSGTDKPFIILGFVQYLRKRLL